jgi:sterol desaturase/sphingolipid hydroxylase (fatty acid hydroxylase superfamily)
MLAPFSHALISLVSLGAVYGALERAFPARPGQAMCRPRWWTDLAFFLGQYLVWTVVALVTLRAVSGWVTGAPLDGLRGPFAAQPFWLQAVEFLAASDVSVYWLHRACHRFPWLWRFHAVHHTAEHLDWLAAHREHPLDGILTELAINVPGMVLGFPISSLAWFAAFRGLWAIFIHANIRLPLGPLRVLFGAPELHHWHHRRVETHANFANLAPWTDLLFGTFHLPEGPERWELGLDEPFPPGYWALLTWPLRRPRRLIGRTADGVPPRGHETVMG